MPTKSRVEEFTELRKKISSLDTYSFDESPTQKKNLPPTSGDHLKPLGEDNPRKTDTVGIKKNTLSLSIDELIKEHDSYDSAAQKKEAREMYHKRKKEERRNSKNVFGTLSFWIWVIIIMLIIALMVLVVLVITGVL